MAVAWGGVSACGSTSKSTTSANATAGSSTPATPSTPSTTSTTAASGPLTKATATSAAKSYQSASAPFIAAVKAGNLRAFVAAVPKQVTALRDYIAQLSALKASSPVAATAQQQYSSVLKQQAALAEQLGKAASANDANTYKAVTARLQINQAQAKVAARQLYAALP
jgi:hypothetical protein